MPGIKSWELIKLDMPPRGRRLPERKEGTPEEKKLVGLVEAEWEILSELERHWTALFGSWTLAPDLQIAAQEELERVLSDPNATWSSLRGTNKLKALAKSAKDFAETYAKWKAKTLEGDLNRNI